jgi:hypothetical protein
LTKYDDADYHEGSAIEAGQPAENAFTHIGLYLGWLIRQDMVDPEFFGEDGLAAVKAGTMTGSDLQSDVDSKQMSDMLTAEGAGFSDWYYEKYLDDYAEAFPDGGDYSIVDDEASRANIDPILDRRYSEWTEAGRPEAPSADGQIHDLSDLIGQRRPTVTISMPDGTQLRLDSHKQAFAQDFIARMRDKTDTVAPLWSDEVTHDAPDLEALIPTDLGMQVRSVNGVPWRNSELRRALEDLGMSLTDVQTAVGEVNRGRGQGWLSVSIMSVPGVKFPDIEQVFAAVYMPRQTKYKGMRALSGRQVHWSSGYGWEFAWWSHDGLVIDCSALDEAALEDLIARLP